MSPEELKNLIAEVVANLKLKLDVSVLGENIILRPKNPKHEYPIITCRIINNRVRFKLDSGVWRDSWSDILIMKALLTRNTNLEYVGWGSADGNCILISYLIPTNKEIFAKAIREAIMECYHFVKQIRIANRLIYRSLIK